MKFEINFHQRVRNFLRKLDSTISIRIIKKIKSIANEPFRYLKHFESKNLYKLRIGDYRALINVDIEHKILLIQILDKRSRIYKR